MSVQEGSLIVPQEDPLSSAGPSLSSAGSRPMPHFQQLLANIQVSGWPPYPPPPFLHFNVHEQRMGMKRVFC